MLNVVVTESSSSEDSIEQQQDHQISEQDNNHQNSDRSIAKQTKGGLDLKRDYWQMTIFISEEFFLKEVFKI